MLEPYRGPVYDPCCGSAGMFVQSVEFIRARVDARKLGHMVDRTHRELTDEDIERIGDRYHAWRSEENAKPQGYEGAKKRESLGGSAPSRLCGYSDVPGFCKSAPLEEVRKHGHVLTLGRCVGAEAVEDDGEPFEVTMMRLTATLYQHQAEGAKLDAAIAANLKELRYGG